MKLTQKAVAPLTLPKRKSEAIFFDDDLPGFGLRLRRGGSRVWVFQYKIGTKHRRMTLGAYPAIKPDQARETAGKMHAAVRLGRDPAGEKAEGRTRAAETMDAALRAYLPQARERLKPRSYREVERHLLVHAKLLHGLQLAKIERRSVAARLAEIAAASGPAAANRVRASVSAFFAWALREGLVEDNPVIGTNKAHESGARERVLTGAELRAIWHGLKDDHYGAIVRLLMLTGQRRDEIGSLRWSEIADTAMKITLPSTRTKNKREHVVPLSGPALAILKAQTRRTNGEEERDLIFGIGEGGFSGWSDCKHALDDAITEEEGQSLPHWTLHDLRRSAATGMAERGVQPHVIEAVLNHVGHKGGVAGIYNRASYEREKTAALSLWADHVTAIVEGRKSKIVPLRA